MIFQYYSLKILQNLFSVVAFTTFLTSSALLKYGMWFYQFVFCNFGTFSFNVHIFVLLQNFG